MRSAIDLIGDLQTMSTAAKTVEGMDMIAGRADTTMENLFLIAVSLENCLGPEADGIAYIMIGIQAGIMLMNEVD